MARSLTAVGGLQDGWARALGVAHGQGQRQVVAVRALSRLLVREVFVAHPYGVHFSLNWSCLRKPERGVGEQPEEAYRSVSQVLALHGRVDPVAKVVEQRSSRSGIKKAALTYHLSNLSKMKGTDWFAMALALG